MRYGRGVGLLAITLALTACGSSADPTAWTDKVCGSMVTVVDAAQKQPEADRSDLPKTLRNFSNYLGSVITALDTSLGDLKAVGPSPVAGGDDAVKKLEATFTTAKAAFERAKAKADTIDGSDPQEVQTEFPEVLTPLQEGVTAFTSLGEFKNSPELDAAAKNAPNCQKLEALGKSG